MSAQAPAWLLDVCGPCLIAVGRHEVLEVLEHPRGFPYPLGPPHCEEVVFWRDRPLPLADLSRLGGGRPGELDASHFAVVTAYQHHPEAELEYGVLKVIRPPLGIQVDDQMQADPPPDLPASWRRLTLSCFRHGEAQVLAPDLAKLFRP